MRFDAFIFPVFFLVVVLLYWRLRSIKAQNILILASSYVFYGWWDWRFLGLLALSTCVDYLVSLRLSATDVARHRRQLLFVSIGVNLGILGLFKYFDFFVTSFTRVFDAFGFTINPALLHVILPMGISFYTFQTLAYTIDVYRRKIQPERNLVAFGCYVAFFPQLVAGPIERAQSLLPQFHQRRQLTSAMWRSGITLIIFGLVKKIAVADNLAPFVNWVFSLSGNQASGALVFAGSLAFAIQIYADFSAYSDIARGISKLLGFELSVNFNKPYLSRSPSEFWRRWHISLSSWLKDYLYIPLGGNQRGRLLTYRNLMITMILGGLWHGAAWNFVLWGLYHGVLLSAYRAGRVDQWLNKQGRAVSILAGMVFFLLTLYGWMLFRAESLDQMAGFTAALFGAWSQWRLALPLVMIVMYFSLPIIVHHTLSRGLGGEKWRPTNPLVWRVFLAAIVVFGVIHGRSSGQAFIYFQF